MARSPAVRRSPDPSRRWWWLGGLGVLAVAAMIVAMGSVRTYLKSDGFRQLVQAEAGRALRSRVELGPLVWSDGAASVERVTAVGDPGAPLTQLEARDLRAGVHLGAIWNRCWHIPRIEAAALTVDVTPIPEAADSATGTVETPGATDSPGWLAGWLPNRLQIDEISLPRTTLRYSRDGTVIRLEGTELTLRPRDGSIEVEGHGGHGTWGEGRDFILDDLSARLADGTLFLTDARVHSAAGGTRIAVSGEIGRQTALRLIVSNLGAAELLATDWKQRLHGKVDGEVRIDGLTADGTLTLRDGRLELLPLLDALAQHTKNEDFRRLTITEAKGRFHRTDGRLEVREFALDGPTLRLAGHCDVVAGQLDGVFEVGIAPGTLRWVPGAESRVFVRRENGFLWATMRVTGPVDAPAEDLTSRLVDAAVTQTLIDAPQKAIDTARQAVDAATGLGTTAIDAGSRVLDKGADALKGFVPFFK